MNLHNTEANKALVAKFLGNGVGFVEKPKVGRPRVDKPALLKKEKACHRFWNWYRVAKPGALCDRNMFGVGHWFMHCRVVKGDLERVTAGTYGIHAQYRKTNK